jgi:diguanylate cyclase (GGDEF)-like protein/PAS domain S-box-containing protein
MKEKKIKLLYIQNILLFLGFGVAVAIATTYINFNHNFELEQKKVDKDSVYISNTIKSNIHNYLNKIENSILSIQRNDLFLNYIQNQNENNKVITQNLFLNSMYNNENFFQFRFLDENGMEKIRVDRERNTNNLFVVKDEKLQDKSKRYYFTETLNSKSREYWHSNLDLNVENGEIEKPLKPTYRISSNVYYKGKFYGILIVNVEMTKMLTMLRSNNQFSVYLFDNDGNFILNPDTNKEWGKYLNNGHTIFSEFPDISKEAFNSNKFNTFGYIFPLKEIFTNNENIKLILKVKDEYLKGVKSHNTSYAFTLGLIILVISLPIGLIISYPLSKVYLNINKLYKENLRYTDTIDKYVITMTVNLDKKITDVSSALCNVTGYKKEELIGKTPSIFKSGKMDDKVYKDLWNKISSGFVWSGELQNRTKEGEIYWLKTNILPNLSIKNDIVESYTSLSEDITDKKQIEVISQTDKLTQLYNRVKLDESLEYEMNRFIRHSDIFSIILIDMDKFKSVNDNYGHQVGDSVLIKLSEILKTHSRKIDIVGRWGGEEFMIICIDTDIKGATHFAENLRIAVEEYVFDVVKHKTISVGVTEVKRTDNIETLIKRVDDYLYEAKESGRNRVISDIKS